MTKSDFLKSVPPIINHKENGFGKIEIVANTKDNKGACYKFEDNTASGGTYAKTWLEVYLNMMDYLKKQGHTQDSYIE